MNRFACGCVSLICAGALTAGCGSGIAAENRTIALQDPSFGPDPCSIIDSSRAGAAGFAVFAGAATAECAVGALVLTVGTGEEACLIPAAAATDAEVYAMVAAGTAVLFCAKAKANHRAGNLAKGVSVTQVDRHAAGKTRCTEDTLARLRQFKQHFCTNPNLPLSCDSAKNDLGLGNKGLSGANQLTIAETIAYCAELGARLSNGAQCLAYRRKINDCFLEPTTEEERVAQENHKNEANTIQKVVNECDYTWRFHGCDVVGAVAPSGGPGVLDPGQGLNLSNAVKSHDGRFSFALEANGDLVLKDDANRRLWSAGTAGRGHVAFMQPDGNLVVYDSNKNWVWRSQTDNHPGAHLVVEDHGNAVIFDVDGNRIWQTHTLGDVQILLSAGASVSSPDKRYMLVMQGDGNLVLYQGSHPLWASKTVGKGGTMAAMQTDGNLVIYNNDYGPVWASRTPGQSNAQLVVQNDGNAVIYDQNHRPVWATNTVHPICTQEEISHSSFSSTGRYYWTCDLNGDGNRFKCDNNGDKEVSSCGNHPCNAASPGYDDYCGAATNQTPRCSADETYHSFYQGTYYWTCDLNGAGDRYTCDSNGRKLTDACPNHVCRPQPAGNSDLCMSGRLQ